MDYEEKLYHRLCPNCVEKLSRSRKVREREDKELKFVSCPLCGVRAQLAMYEIEMKANRIEE